MHRSVVGLIGLVGIVTLSYGATPASADNLKSIARTLNAIVNPEDAWRLEDQARRYRHRDEEHYWSNYGAGLEQQHREHGGGGPPPYGAPGRYMTPIDPDETYRLQDQAQRFGRADDERYWEQYRQGLGGPPGPR